MFPNYYYTVDDSYFKEHACEHADLWKLQLSVSSWIYYIDYKMRTWCSMVHVPEETYITD